MPLHCLGIYRERRFSPGVHAAGDAEILERTQVALIQAGYQTQLIAPERLPGMAPVAPVVFSMCQSLEALAVLEGWEHQGVLVLNPPAAVRACYRLALVQALSQTTLPFPRSVVLPLADLPSQATLTAQLPPSPGGWWVKRGDVHAMQADDVQCVSTTTALLAHLASFQARGVQHAVVQEHRMGQELKFYAVRGYGIVHTLVPPQAPQPTVDLAQLTALAQQASAAVGLDIYGGDCLVAPDGSLSLIDLNDWPSFRGCRPQAATYIARHIITQARQRGLLAPSSR